MRKKRDGKEVKRSNNELFYRLSIISSVTVFLSLFLLLISSCSYDVNDREKLKFREIRNLSSVYQGIVDVNGSLVFTNGEGVKIKDRLFIEKSYIYLENKKINSKYEFLTSPKDINGKLAYIGFYRNKSFAVYNNQEFGEDFDSVSSISEVNEKLAYVGVKGEKSYVVINEIPLNSYDSIFPDIVNLGDGSIAYAVEKDKNIFVVLDRRTKLQSESRPGAQSPQSEAPSGAQSGAQSGPRASKVEFGPYDSVSFLTHYESSDESNSKIAFIASRNNTEFVVLDGKEIMQSYQFYGLKKINKDLAALVQKDGKYFVVLYSDTSIDSDVSRDLETSNTSNINGKIKEIGKEYEGVFEIEDINNTLAYVARNASNGKFLVIVNDKVMAQDYDFISDLTDVNGNLAFVAQKGEGREGREGNGKVEKFIKYKGKSIRNYNLEKENPLYSVGGKLVFIAQDLKSGKDMVVIET